MTNEKESLNKFFKPSISKLIIIMLLIILYFVTKPLCSPILVDTFNPNNVGPGLIYPCGKFLSEVYSLANNNAWSGLVWLT